MLNANGKNWHDKYSETKYAGIFALWKNFEGDVADHTGAPFKKKKIFRMLGYVCSYGAPV